MKLFELDATRQTKQAAKVFESYFGNSISFDALNRTQTRHMLNRVRSLIAEHRSKPSFHTSEQNPSYMKLVVMEQGLAAKMREDTGMISPGQSSMQPNQQTGAAPAQAQPNPAQMAMNIAQQKKQIQDQIKAEDEKIKASTMQKQKLQQQLSSPNLAMAESHVSRLYGKLYESEVQQAQVVLASQDMVDQVQKMLEQVTSMQFKDLPALVDQVKNQIGADQAVQFNQDVTGALTTLTQNLQGSKQQLEGALGVVTGQAPTIPGEAPATVQPVGGELPAPEGEEEIDVGLEEPEEEPIRGPGASDLGRARR